MNTEQNQSETGKKIKIGLMMEHNWEIDMGYLSEVFQGALEESEKLNIQLIRFTCGFLSNNPLDKYENQRNILFPMAGPDIVDGLIISSTTLHFINDKDAESLRTLFERIPAVGLGPVPFIPCVEVNNQIGMKKAMEHLVLHHNYRDIAFIRGPINNKEADIRFRIYREVLEENGIPYNEDLIVQGDFLLPSGKAAVKILLDERKVSFQALMSSNDAMAISAVDELQSRNILVPYDVAVIGFDDIVQSAYTIPSITTVHQPLQEIGKAAVSAICNLIQGKKTPDEQMTLDTYLTIRRSCGCKNQIYQNDISSNENIRQSKNNKLPQYEKTVVYHVLREESGFPNDLRPHWEKLYLDTFMESVNSKNADPFLEHQDLMLRTLLASKLSTLPLQKSLSIIQRYALDLIQNTAAQKEAMLLLEKSRLLICQDSNNSLMMNTFQQAHENVKLHNASQVLMTDFDLENLLTHMSEYLPKLGIPGAYVVLFNNCKKYLFPSPPPPKSRLILAFNNKGIHYLDKKGMNFETKFLLPENIFNQVESNSLSVEVLFFKEELLGYIVYEIKMHKRLKYEVLRGEISSAIKGALLMDSHIENEKELRSHQNQLDELVRIRSEELSGLKTELSSIINSMPSCLISVNSGGYVTQWNKEAAKLTGIPDYKAINKKLIKLIPDLSIEMEYFLSDETPKEKKVRNLRLLDSEGQEFFEEIVLYPLVGDLSGGAVIRIDDVTEKIRIEEMMIQSEKMLSVGGLAAGMAHEINNPLAGMMQTSQVMSRRLTEDLPANLQKAEEIGIPMEKIRDYMESRDIPKMLSRIHETGARAAEIVQNMLSFAKKSASGKSVLSISDLMDKTLILASTDYNLKKQYDFRKIEIVREYQNDVPMVLCEGAKIQQVLLNILKNGAEAMYEEEPRQNPRFTIRIYAEDNASVVVIEIEDNGPGISEEILSRIFEPFFTTKSNNKGTGLGLSVSYFIITQNHNGIMDVKSRKDEGTTFIIKLPIRSKDLFPKS